MVMAQPQITTPGEGCGVGETILALFLHLIPTFLVILILVIACCRGR